jgi:hypothetical protein
MSNICLRNRPSTALPRKRSVSSNWEIGVKARRPAPPATPLLGTLPRCRREIVLAIRRQIAEGTYDLDKHIDAILGLLLKDLGA